MSTKVTISASADASVQRMRAKAKDLHRDWFEIRNAAGEGGEDPTVYIYAEIGDSCWGDSVSAASFVKEFAAIDADRIQLHINSPGGDVWEGIAIANSIRAHKATVVATVDGIAASAASFIACAADELVMARNSELMIHDAWGLVVGNAGDMRDHADRLDQVSNNLASIYAEKAGGEIEDWRAVMLAETWYSAQEAVDAGLADRVDAKKEAEPEAKAKFDLSVFAHAGRAAASAPPRRATHKPPATPAEPTTPKEADMPSDRFLSSVREKLGVPAEIDEDGILAALDETLAEQAETITPATSTAGLPVGVVAIDATVLADLRSDAAAGRDARAQQLANVRDALLDEAQRDGRITTASAATWRAGLEQDDKLGNTTNRDILASLPQGQAVPVAPAGYTGGVAEATDDNVDPRETPAYKNWSM